jgi:hypothetical protein
LLEFEYGSNTAQSASPIVWRPCGAPAAREHKSCLLKKNKFARRDLRLCLFCKNREEKIDLEASRYGFRPMSEAGSNDVVDGLAGRIRKRGRNRKEVCHSGRSLLSF